MIIMRNRFYVTIEYSELHGYLEYEILNLVVHTIMCTNENYGTSSITLVQLLLMMTSSSLAL